MDVLEAIRDRRSIRKYKEVPVPPDKLHKVLEAGRIAPSAGNRQEWKFIVITQKDLKDKMVDACRGQAFVGEAGAVIVVCATDPSRKWHMVDAAIALDHMTLAAHSLGLGTCWIGFATILFNSKEVKQELEVPEDYDAIAPLIIGYPQGDITVTEKNKAEILFWK
jgi:nitroreductase